MKILVAGEFSGIVREAFKAKGHAAWSCDLLDTEIPGQHLKCDVRDILGDNWDLMICHPPCTHLAVSGARWFKDKKKEQKEALDFVRLLLNAPVEKICLENPVSVISSKIRKPDQIIQPWMFGDLYKKTTCLWLKNLPKLIPTCKNGYNLMMKLPKKDREKIHYQSPGPNRGLIRSITPQGFANAIADQWG